MGSGMEAKKTSFSERVAMEKKSKRFNEKIFHAVSPDASPAKETASTRKMESMAKDIQKDEGKTVLTSNKRKKAGGDVKTAPQGGKTLLGS